MKPIDLTALPEIALFGQVLARSQANAGRLALELSAVNRDAKELTSKIIEVLGRGQLLAGENAVSIFSKTSEVLTDRARLLSELSANDLEQAAICRQLAPTVQKLLSPPV